MTKERKYLDFILELRDLDTETSEFKVAVLPSPAVGETDAIRVPYRYDDMENTLDDLERKRVDQEDLISLGEQLAERLLPAGQVRTLFHQAVKKAGQDGGVRLRLLVREPKLAQLPWEFTYLQVHQGEKDRRHFLILNPQVSIVRHEALPEEHPSLAPSALENLRMVVAMANVEGYRKLKLKREKGVIEESLRDFDLEGITIDWEPFIEDATVDDLTKALLKKADLFHFAGHGVFEEMDIDPETGDPIGAGSIVLVEDKETRSPRLWPAGELALHLQKAGVRVAVLGACDSGRRDGVSAWTGVAPALIERGVAAVVAMQYEVLDDHAISFSEMFYSSLLSGLSIDEAVSAARLVMLGKSNEDEVEWGVPVLYMRSPNGIVFPRLAERRTETASEIRRVVRMTVGTIEEGGEVFGIVGKRVCGSFKVIQKVDTVKGRLIGWQADELPSPPCHSQ